MKSLFQSLMVSACLLASLDQSLADTLVKEEKLLLPVQINSNVEQLETLIVKPNDGEKFPLVLIVNGSASGSPAEEHPDWLVAIAHDFAHRGYIAASIVWPGYGLSTGTFMKNGGDCTKPTVSRFLDTHAGDLQAALDALHARPDVDPSVTLGMGFSIGGASMLDLAARPNRPLTAVINISGGVYHYDVLGTPAADCSLYQDDLVRSFTNFGRDNSTPTLWIYAANDPFFEPDLVQRMLAGYRSEGGQVDFVGLPPFQKDGHTLFKNEASVLTEPKIDDFLRRIHLPAMDEDELAPLLSSLPADSRASVKLYMKNVSEKAIAMADNISTVYWYYGAPTIEKARQQALADCRNERGPTCHIVAENLHLADGWRDKMSEANR